MQSEGDPMDGIGMSIVEEGPAMFDDILEMMRANNYPIDIIESTIQSKKKMQEYNNLDRELIEKLRIMSDIDGVPHYQKQKYDEIIRSITKSDFVVYFKKAGLIKVYPTDVLQKYFHSHMETYLRGENEIYELVNKQQPQKIIIIMDNVLKQSLEKIKKYIVSFFNERNVKIPINNIICFNNPIANTIEIILHGWYVNNSIDRETIVKKLTEYIENKERHLDNSLDVTKIDPRRSNDISGTESYLMPHKKLLMKGDNNIRPVVENPSNFIGETAGCNLIKIENFTFNINNSNSINLTGNNNNIMINNSTKIKTAVSKNPSKELNSEFRSYFDYIKTNNPDWYLESEWVSTNILYSKFKEITGSTIKLEVFGRKLGSLLHISSEQKSESGTKIRGFILSPIDELP